MNKLLRSHIKDVSSGSAIAIRQPYIEEILLGTKKIEYRSRITHKRGRVFLYASSGKVPDEARWKKLGKEMYSLPSGVIVGSVDIIDCRYNKKLDCYEYILKNPKRYKIPVSTIMQAQPCFFFPFGKDYSLI